MIISHKHKFIFLRTAKTASSSTEIALSQICGPRDILSPLSDDEELYKKQNGFRGPQNYYIPFKNYSLIDWFRIFYKRGRIIFYNHMSAQELLPYLDPKIWNSYFKFSFERNPWDKMVSFYYWNSGPKKYKTIKEFLLSGVAGEIKGFNVYTIGGIPVVDKVYKYEELEESLLDISKVIGLSKPIKLPTYRAKDHYRTDKRHYREILTDEEAEIIAKLFAREISHFGYEF